MKKAVGLIPLAALALAACVQNDADDDAQKIAVTSTADNCAISSSLVNAPPRSTAAGSRYASAKACPTNMSPGASWRRDNLSPVGSR